MTKSDTIMKNDQRLSKSQSQNTKKCREIKYIMKKILFLLFVPLVSCSQLSKNDLQKENLKGQVKSVKEIAFNGVEKFGEVMKGKLTDYQNVNTLKKFNEKGNEIEIKHYSGDGRTLDYVDKLNYDKKGNRILLEFYRDGKLEVVDKYQYDAKRNRIEEQRYYSDGILSHVEKYKYDEKGNQIETQRYNSDGTPEDSMKKYKYDENGSIIEEQTCYLSDGKCFTTLYKYKYDSKGNKIEEQTNYSQTGGNSTIVSQYKYDSKGNWIIKIESQDQDLLYIERKIEYYE